MRLPLKDFAKMIVKRQVEKKADTFVIIYGLARSGKTTLGFKILMVYLRLVRRLYKLGKHDWLPEKTWFKLLVKYFATDAGDMNSKIKHNPDNSFTFVDEGLDVASWHDRLTRELKELLELIQKTGKKGQLTLLLVNNISILTKELLARAHYLFIIAEEPTPKGNSALLFRNYTNPFLAEKNPFGLNRLFKDIQKRPFILDEPDKFMNYMMRQKRLVATVYFRALDKKLYDLYDKVVKEPSIMKEKEKRRVISFWRYKKLKFMVDLVIFNDSIRGGKKISETQRLFTDKWGNCWISRNTIQTRKNIMMAMEKPPNLTTEEVIDTPIEISESEDISLESSLAPTKKINGCVNNQKETDKNKN